MYEKRKNVHIRGRKMTNNVELIKRDKTSKMYYFLYINPSTKYGMLEKINPDKKKPDDKKKSILRNNDVYNKKEPKKCAFNKIDKYLKEIGKSNRGEPIYQSTSEPLIEEIQNKLKKRKINELTEFEQWVLTTVLESPDTRDDLRNYYFKDFKERIDAYNIIIEEYLGNFVFGNYVNNNILFETPLFEPNESRTKFLKVWDGDDQRTSLIDQDFNILVPSIQKGNKQISELILPTFLQDKQIKRYSNLPRETSSYTKWMALPDSLIYKLISISPKIQNYLSLFSDVMRTFLPIIVLGVIRPRVEILNLDLRKIIASKRKSIDQLLSRHSEFDSLVKNNGT